MKKKIEAKRDVMQKLIRFYFSNVPPNKPNKNNRMGGGPQGTDHYLYSQDDTMSKVKDHISRWQAKNLLSILNVTIAIIFFDWLEKSNK